MEQNDLNREKVYTKFKLKNGNCKVRIAGISMEPFLHNGQYIIAATANDYNVDDVVLYYYKDEGLLIHRVIYKYNEQFFCRGDNSHRIERVNLDEILGKMIKLA